MQTAFPHLFEPLQIRGKRLKNRIMSTGHDTCLPTDNLVNDKLIAYQRDRAAGGVGLIVLQVAGVHDSARYTSHVLMATDDACIDGYRQLAEACHAHGTVVLSQLFHPGREIMESADGLLAVAYSASSVPNERFRVMPRALDQAMIDEIVQGYASAARRLQQAGLDGVEVVASHGYLPAQFLNPRVNLRSDGYNGELEQRLRFLREVLAAVRAATDEQFIIGLRISADERDSQGLSEDESLAAAIALQGQLDYLHIVAGTSASLGGAVHIVPPMAIEPAYLAREAAAFKQQLAIPLFVTGRINQPQDAELILARGQADVCGMTRALICDPLMPNKTERGQVEDVRACIACNQACIGHFHRGLAISCIQRPETGRELQYGQLTPTVTPKRILVAGGGPSGMKAAARGRCPRASGNTVRGWPPTRRPGAAGPVATAPRRVRRGQHQPAAGNGPGRRGSRAQHPGRPRLGRARAPRPGHCRHRCHSLLASVRTHWRLASGGRLAGAAQ